MNVWRNTRTIKEKLRKRLQDRMTFSLWLGTWRTIQMRIWPMTFGFNGQMSTVKQAIIRKKDAAS